MYLKLTNAAEAFKDRPVLINMSQIVSLNETNNVNNEPITLLYGNTKDVWEVRETIDQIHELLKG